MEFRRMTGVEVKELSANLKRPIERAEAASLPFYKNGFCVDVEGRFYLVVGGERVDSGTIFELTGSSDPIYGGNLIGGLTITEDTVVAYLAFFCEFIKGEEGEYYVLEGTAGDGWMIEGPVVEKDGEIYRIKCFTRYGGRLYRCRYEVMPAGEVEMLKGEHIDIEDFPTVN